MSNFITCPECGLCRPKDSSGKTLRGRIGSARSNWKGILLNFIHDYPIASEELEENSGPVPFSHIVFSQDINSMGKYNDPKFFIYSPYYPNNGPIAIKGEAAKELALVEQRVKDFDKFTHEFATKHGGPYRKVTIYTRKGLKLFGSISSGEMTEAEDQSEDYDYIQTLPNIYNLKKSKTLAEIFCNSYLDKYNEDETDYDDELVEEDEDEESEEEESEEEDD